MHGCLLHWHPPREPEKRMQYVGLVLRHFAETADRELLARPAQRVRAEGGDAQRVRAEGVTLTVCHGLIATS